MYHGVKGGSGFKERAQVTLRGCFEANSERIKVPQYHLFVCFGRLRCVVLGKRGVAKKGERERGLLQREKKHVSTW